MVKSIDHMNNDNPNFVVESTLTKLNLERLEDHLNTTFVDPDSVDNSDEFAGIAKDDLLKFLVGIIEPTEITWDKSMPNKKTNRKGLETREYTDEWKYFVEEFLKEKTEFRCQISSFSELDPIIPVN